MDSLFCGKATAVASVHRTLAKSRLSSPTSKNGNKSQKNTTRLGGVLLAPLVGLEPTTCGLTVRLNVCGARCAPCRERLRCTPTAAHKAAPLLLPPAAGSCFGYLLRPLSRYNDGLPIANSCSSSERGPKNHYQDTLKHKNTLSLL